MLDDGECPKTVHFQFVNPVRIIERSGPLQVRHWLELEGHRATRIAKIDKELSSKAGKLKHNCTTDEKSLDSS